MKFASVLFVTFGTIFASSILVCSLLAFLSLCVRHGFRLCVRLGTLFDALAITVLIVPKRRIVALSGAMRQSVVFRKSFARKVLQRSALCAFAES